MIDEVPGAADIIMGKTAGLPQISIKYYRERFSQYAVSVDELNRIVQTAFAGTVSGVISEGEKRFDSVVRLPKDFRHSFDKVKSLIVGLPNGAIIPLTQLVEITYAQWPAKISRDNTHRRVVVSVIVRNRDLESVVKDIQKILDSKLTIPAGYYVDCGGQLENLRNPRQRLLFAVPVALALIFIFLHYTFHSLKDALWYIQQYPYP